MSITSYNSIFSKPFPKTLILEFDDDPQTVISNDKVVQESMELEETLCSDSNLKYGCCESSCFNVRVVNNGSLKGKTFTAKLQFQSRGILINDSGDYIENDEGSYIGTYNSSNVDTITIGNYKVYSDKPTSDRAYRDLMCYDLMYDILDVDVASWYNGLTFPMTLKSFRDSLFTFLGVTQDTTTLINDNYTVKGNYQVDSLSCKDVLQSICEVNGVFGHINRLGNFEYISLPSVETVVLDHHINGKGGYEDFVTSAITGVECIPIDSDIGTKVGTDTNLYILDNNLIFYGDEGSQEQVAALTNLLNKIKTFTYRPCSITTYGNPMMEIGTSIVDTVNDLIVESFVMSRYLSGIQAMKDEYRAYGDEKYPENVNSLKTSVKRLSGKTIKLDTEITNMGAKTVLKLTADGRIVEVALDATPSGSSVKIKADNIDFIADGKIQLTSKSLAISSTNFEVTSAGVITAKSGTIGPWKMTTTDLYDSAADSGTGVGAGIGKNGTTVAFWAGSNYANRNSAPFRVSHSGAVNASNLVITGGSITLGTKFSVTSAGVITATSGSIGGWNLSTTSLSYGGSSIDRGGSITLKQTSSSSNGLSLSYDGISLYSGVNWYNVLLIQNHKITLNAEEVVAGTHKLTSKLNATDGVYKDTVSNTSGQVMHARALGHSYQCNWTGSQLDFYVDTTGVGTLSDKRLKKEIKDVHSDLLEAINKCPMKQFKADNRGGLISFGIIAQDLVENCKEYGIDILDYEILQKKQYKLGDDTEYYMIDNGQLAILEISALKEQIKELKSELEGLKNE